MVEERDEALSGFLTLHALPYREGVDPVSGWKILDLGENEDARRFGCQAEASEGGLLEDGCGGSRGGKNTLAKTKEIAVAVYHLWRGN